MKSIFILFDNIISLYIWVLIINVIMSWLVAFNVVNTSKSGNPAEKPNKNIVKSFLFFKCERIFTQAFLLKKSFIIFCK